MKSNHFTPNKKIAIQGADRIWVMPEDFNETTLTPEEMEYAIYDARCEKYFIEKEKKEKARKTKEFMNCCTPFTTQQLREYVLQQYPSFKVYKQNEDIFNKLCQYFSNDPSFENDGLGLSKSLLLTGPVGVGKTELLKIFTKNNHQYFHLISVFEIESFCQKHGVGNFKTYTEMVPGWGNTVAYFYQKSVAWAFDDISRESVLFDFGNKSDVVSKIIQT